MQDERSTSKRDLIARVATLELLVADLIDELWRIDPVGMGKLAHQADHDLEARQAGIPLPLAEHQRERLYAVLETRRRMLTRKKSDA